MAVLTRTYNTTMGQGTTWELIVEISFDGTPMNLTDYTARMQMKNSYQSAAVLTLDSGDEIVIDPLIGKLTITVPEPVTAKLNAATYVYDLIIISSTDVVTRVLEGKITVTPRVTT